MKSPLFIFVFFLQTISIVNAQFKVLAEGPVFEEQTIGKEKLIQLKNGNTFYVHLNTKKNYKFYFYLYNSAHIKTKESTFSLEDPNKDFNIESISEQKGDLMLILSYYEKYSLVLFRILVDGNSGIVKESKQIADAGAPTPPALREEAFAGFPPRRVYVIQNATDNSYLIVMQHNAAEKNRIEFVQFDQNHKEIRKAFFPAPDESYKYMYLADVTGINTDNIALLCHPYNTRSSGGKRHELILYTLNMANNESTVNKLPFSSENIVASGIIRYNYKTNELLTLFATEEKSNSGNYTTYISSMSNTTKKVLYTKEVLPTAALQKSKETFSRKKNKINSPLNLLTNDTGGFSILYEDIDYPYENASSFSAQYTANLGNIAVQQFDAKGNEKGSFLIPKSQTLNKSLISLHYQKEHEKDLIELDNGKQYKYFSYLETLNKSYIFLNDSPENIKNIEKGNISTVMGIGETEAFYLDISGTAIIPSRNQLFPTTNSVGLFAVSGYDAVNNIFVTLKLVKGGKNNGMRLVWLQP